eukprot:g605.t1
MKRNESASSDPETSEKEESARKSFKRILQIPGNAVVIRKLAHYTLLMLSVPVMGHPYKDGLSALVGVLLVNAVVVAYVIMAFSESPDEADTKRTNDKKRA